MKRKLQRILRLRKLLEDLAELDFETKMAEAQRLEQAAAGKRLLALLTRSDGLHVLAERTNEATPQWLLGVADAEILAWTGSQLEGLALECRPAVEIARTELLSQRLDRRQLELLVDAAAIAEESSELRREQMRADDWFQGRVARLDRKRK